MVEREELKPLDYYQEKLDRITSAFEDAEVFKKYLKLFSEQTNELQSAFFGLLTKRWVDTAEGENLDVLGRIVGQPRVLLNVDLIPYFGYQGFQSSQSFGDLNDPKVGGFYWSLDRATSGNVTLNDEQYRTFIKAKIIKNVTRATPEDVIRFIKFVFNAKRIQVSVDMGAEQAVILVSDDLSPFEIEILKYFVEHEYKSYFVPKALGVGIKFGTLPSEDYFGYQGSPEAKGYGIWINGEVTGGGTYASLF